VPDDAKDKLLTMFVTRVANHSVSEDGTLAVLVCDRQDGTQVAVAMRPEQVGRLADQVNELFHAILRKKLSTGSSVLRYPDVFGVSTHESLRGGVILGFDPGTTHEANFVLGINKMGQVDPTFAVDVGRQVLRKAEEISVKPQGRNRIILPPGVR